MGTRRLPVPITFLVVVLATILLVIFFGAWAASADSGDRDRTLTFGFASSGTDLNATALNSSDAAVSGAESATGGSEEDADKGWWQSAFLKACPLH